jgi:HAMP domain-containing protein
MLRRLDVRTRLVTVIIVPIVLLLLVAVPELFDRQDRAQAADVAGGLASAGAEIADVADAIQAERTTTAVQVAGGELPEGTLDERRAATDAAVDDAMTALRKVAAAEPGLRELAVDAAALLDGLDDARAELDADRAIVPWVDPFEPVLESLLTVEERLGGSVRARDAGGELADAALLARARQAATSQDAAAAAAVVWGDLRGDQINRLRSLRADELVYGRAFVAAAQPGQREARERMLEAGSVSIAGRVVDSVAATETVEPVGDLASLLTIAAERQGALRSAESDLIEASTAAAGSLGDSARRSASLYALLAGTGLLLAVAIALLAARSITRPLRRLTDAADDLAAERLPKLVDALRHPGGDDERYLAATVESLEVTSDDELGRLAASFNAIQTVAVDVAAQQADLLRKGIGDLYVNLARRNQSLIERQIQLLDRLEAEEEDPDVLEHLFLLDHLATRMRRNAESLLVLAGAEQGQRRSRPLDVVDVVRAAVSEVEDYERIQLGGLAPAVVLGTAASDIAHITAELLENATHFSPPDTTVQVVGSRTGGSYQLVILDRGIGMSTDQLDELNAVLRDPPVTGLALGRSLGCLVAARLAARHGITLRLRPGRDGGTAAYVVLPRHLIADPVAAIPADAVPTRPAAAPVREIAASAAVAPSPPLRFPAPDRHAAATQQPAAAASPAPTHRPVPEPSSPAVAPAAPSGLPARLRDALPSSSTLDADLQRLVSGRNRPPLVEPPVAPADHTPASEAAPLVRRVPGASGAADAAGVGDEPRTRRSPDEVRSLLSQYRSGLRAGRSADATPTATPAGPAPVASPEERS